MKTNPESTLLSQHIELDQFSAYALNCVRQVAFRLAFAFVPLALCVLIAISGQFGTELYQLTAVPVWYFVNFYIIAYPFMVIYNHSTPVG